MHRTQPSTEGHRPPTSGLILGKVAEYLSLKEVLSGTELASTASRFFAGKRIEPDKHDAIVKALADAFAPPGSDVRFDRAAGSPLVSELIELIAASLHRWDEIVTNPNQVRRNLTRPEDLPWPGLRLLGLQVGLRLGCWALLRRLDKGPIELPDGESEAESIRWCRESIKRWIDAHRRDETLESLAHRLAEHARLPDWDPRRRLDEWRNEGVVPELIHLTLLTEVLAPGDDSGEALMGLRLRAGLWACVRDLIALNGEARAGDFVAAVMRTAKKTHDRGLRFIGPHTDIAEQLRPSLRNVVLSGSSCPEGKSLIRELLGEKPMNFEVMHDLLAMHNGTWDRRIDYWAAALENAPHEIDALRKRFPDSPEWLGEMILAHTFKMARWDVEPDPRWVVRAGLIPAPPDIEAMNWYAIGEDARSVGELDHAIHAYQRAVALAPDEPVLHFRLGAMLGEKGFAMGDGRLIKRGIDECWIAFGLDPSLGNAAHEVAVLYHNAGHFSEALVASDKAAATHADHAHYWYCRGNTLRCLERWDEAEQAFARACELTAGGEHLDAMPLRVALLERLGRRKQANDLRRRITNRLHAEPTESPNLMVRPPRLELG